MAFHTQDGLFFERLADGGVAVEKWTQISAKDRMREMRIELTPEVWASVVASMSKAGETYETWKAALERQHT